MLLLMSVSLYSVAQNTINTKLSTTDFMKSAVLEGLQNNNFDIALAKTVSKDYSLYIGKCNICNGVRFAFDTYSKTVYNNNTTYTTVKQLTDTATIVKLKALETLVQQYVQAYYTNHAYTQEQKSEMQQQIENQAMQSKRMTNGKYCASCTGSCKKPE